MILVKLKSRKNNDIENAIAEAYQQGVIAGIKGARGEKIPEQNILIAPTASIQGSFASGMVCNAMCMAGMANPIHNESTESIIEHYQTDKRMYR